MEKFKKKYNLTPQKILFKTLSEEEKAFLKEWYKKKEVKNFFVDGLGFHIKDIFSEQEIFKTIGKAKNTIFHHATQHGDITICLMLLYSWPQGMIIKNKYGKTPLTILQDNMQTCSDKEKKTEYENILDAIKFALDAQGIRCD